MKADKLTRSWSAALGENKFLKIIISALVLCNLIAVSGWQSKDAVVRLIPPTLTEETVVAQNQADEVYHKSFALHVANLIGNVSPDNVQFIISSIEPLLSPAIRNEVMTILADQVDSIQTNELSMTYRAREVIYDPVQNMTWVSGIQTRKNRDGTENSQIRTFEIVLRVKNGLPEMNFIDAYPDVPKLKRKNTDA